MAGGSLIEPRIQYAKTGDGVDSAYWMLGEGMAFVSHAQLMRNHIQLEWQNPHGAGRRGASLTNAAVDTTLMQTT